MWIIKLKEKGFTVFKEDNLKRTSKELNNLKIIMCQYKSSSILVDYGRVVEKRSLALEVPGSTLR